MTRKEQRELQRAIRAGLILVNELAELSAAGQPVSLKLVALATRPVSILMDMALPDEEENPPEPPPQQRKELVSFSGIVKRGPAAEHSEHGTEYVEVFLVEAGEKIGQISRTERAGAHWEANEELYERYGGNTTIDEDLDVVKAWVLDAEEQINESGKG